jgi:Thioesterase domain
LPSGVEVAAVSGVSAATGRDGSAEAARSRPHLVGQFHGILTRKSNPSWPQYGDAFFANRFPKVRTVNSRYYQLPFPRVAAVKNSQRSRDLTRQIDTAARLLAEQAQEQPAISLVSHSNGAVLAMQVARSLIERGRPLQSLVLIAPATPTRSTSREVADWLSRGMLDYALLVRPSSDLVIGTIGANWQTRLLAWPWGALGHDGWAAEEFQVSEFQASGRQETICLPDMGHSDPVHERNWEWLYTRIVGPALGLSPWLDLQPEGEGAV